MNIFRRRRARLEAVCGPTTVYQRVMELLPWALVLGTVIYLAAAWRTIPDEIPVNYDMRGNITRMGGKGNLLVMPAFMFVGNVLMWIVGFFPQSWNIGVRVSILNRVRAYGMARDMVLELQLLITATFFLLSLTMIGPQWAFSRWYMKGGIWLPLLLTAAPLVRFFVRAKRLR